MVEDILKVGNPSLDIVNAQERYSKNNNYLVPEIPAKFLAWLLLEADTDLFQGKVIGVYNKKHQACWSDCEIFSPYGVDIDFS